MAREQTQERVERPNGRTTSRGSDPLDPTPTTRRGGLGGAGPTGWLALLLALAAIAAIVVWAIVDGDSAGPETGATIEEITDDPAGYLGERVTVSGEVEQVFFLEAANPDSPVAQDPGGLAFTLDGEDLLVVSAGSSGEFLTEGDVVQVTGTVREFEADAFGDDFSLGFDDTFFIDFDGPAIVAASIDPTVPEQDAGGSSG